MELEQLQTQWHLLDQKLNRTLAMHSDVLRQMTVQRARQRVNRLTLWPVIDLIFGIAVLFSSASTLLDHGSRPMLAVASASLMLAAVVFLIDNVRQLVFVSEISWDGPIAQIQLPLSRLRHARVRQFKWVILLSPLLGFCMLIVGPMFLLGVNVLESFNPAWIVGNIAFGCLFVPAGAMIIRALRKRWHDHAFWKSWMDDISGHSLVAAQRELRQWVELENEAST